MARNCLSSPGASQDQDISLTEAEQCPEQGCPDKEQVGHPELAGQRDEQGEQGLSAGDAQSAQAEQGLLAGDAQCTGGAGAFHPGCSQSTGGAGAFHRGCSQSTALTGK